nr:MAG TPA: beta sliding clamp [Caudoviricetes sp.]
MADKEFNLAILNKLYEIAFAVWEKMAKVADYGSYSASEIANKVNKEFCFSNEQNEDEKITLSVGTYTCSFPLKNIFYFVSVFEKLASVGRNARQFVFEESGELLGKVTFEVSKGMSELCKFVADDELRPVMNYIILDAANNCLVASDGHKLLSFPTKVLEHSGDLSNFYINPKKFALMCKKMKKGEVYSVTATKESVNGKECNKLEFDGITSNIGYIGRYPNWKSVFPKVSSELALHFDKNAWNEIKKFCKVAKKDGANTISLHGLSGESKITLSYDDCKRELAIENKLQHTIDDVSFMIKSIIAFDSVDTLYLGKSSSHAAVATNSLGNIYLLMPAVYEDRGYSIDTRYVPFDIDVLEERANERTNKPTEDVIPAKVDNVTTEEKECATEKKTEQTDKTANVVPLDKSSNKFSFVAIGVNVGDTLTFVDGTEVIAAEDNKVSFCGELFTLSGFCKEFMPDEKRTKSNSYRGCAFFFKDGVKLEKLFKDAQKKSLVSSKEEIAAVPDDTLDSVPNEHLASEKCTERTIIPLAKENVSEHKETASTAKVVAISIGVPSCLDIPPNNMRLDIAANKPLNVAVGDCLCGVGKVVHTLPLPPPQSKRMSEITKVNQLIKKQKWKYIS